MLPESVLGKLRLLRGLCGVPVPCHGERPAAPEPVDLVDADPAWTVQGEQERDRLETLLAPWLIAHIESHVETRNTASRSYWTPPACASSGLML